MTTSASSLVKEIQTELQDSAGVRWSAGEIVAHLNEGLLDIIVHRPDAKAVHVEFTPVQGAKQTLPEDAVAFIDIAGNTIRRKRAITKVDKDKLDRVSPGWQGMRPAVEILHFTYDLNDPRVFYVYPPAMTSARFELVHSAYPSQIQTPNGADYSSVVGLVDIRDTFVIPLKHYGLFKAWSKDAEFGGNATLAAAHKSIYEQALGIQRASATAVAPKT